MTVAIEQGVVRLDIKGTVQSIIVYTSFPPFTFLYQAFYNLSIRVITVWLSQLGGVRSLYLRRGVAKGEVVYALSDIDLLIIVDDKNEDPEAVVQNVRTAYNRLSRFIPLLGSGDKELGIYSTSDFFNLYQDFPFYRYRFTEGKCSWKLLFGKDLVKELPQFNDSELHLAATEELKTWWSYLNEEFSMSPTPKFKRKYLWYKAIAEAAKIYLFVCHGKNVSSRKSALLEVRSYLPEEKRHIIDRLQSYMARLTGREELVTDELMALFITLVDWSNREAEKGIHASEEGVLVTATLPSHPDVTADASLAKLVARLQKIIKEEVGETVEYTSLIPQIEFSVNTLDNFDIDSFYLLLALKDFIPVENLAILRSLFDGILAPFRIEPFVVFNGSIALSLGADRNPYHCIKSPGRYPLFFCSMRKGALNQSRSPFSSDDRSIRCYLPSRDFKETIGKRNAKIEALTTGKDIYKMKTPDFLRFFWGSARTRLLARSLDNSEITIPLTSRQILEMLVEFSHRDADWLRALHTEYTKELLGEENESYSYFSKAIAFLNRV